MARAASIPVIALDGTDPSRLRDARNALRRERVTAQTAVYTYPVPR